MKVEMIMAAGDQGYVLRESYMNAMGQILRTSMGYCQATIVLGAQFGKFYDFRS
jgi:hypothetical protein